MAMMTCRILRIILLQHYSITYTARVERAPPRRAGASASSGRVRVERAPPRRAGGQLRLRLGLLEPVEVRVDLARGLVQADLR